MKEKVFLVLRASNIAAEKRKWDCVLVRHVEKGSCRRRAQEQVTERRFSLLFICNWCLWI